MSHYHENKINNNNRNSEINNIANNINNINLNNQTNSSGFTNTGNNFYNQEINQYNINPQLPPPSLSLASSVISNVSNNSNFIRNNIRNYYMNFVEEQLGIIDEYEEKINNNNNSNSNYESIIKEKNEALNQLQTSQNFKNNFGMLPMNEQFNNKVANIIDLILEQKVKDIKNNNYVNNINNEININSKNNNLLKESKKSTNVVNLDENEIGNSLNYFLIAYNIIILLNVDINPNMKN